MLRVQISKDKYRVIHIYSIFSISMHVQWYIKSMPCRFNSQGIQMYRFTVLPVSSLQGVFLVIIVSPKQALMKEYTYVV